MGGKKILAFSSGANKHCKQTRTIEIHTIRKNSVYEPLHYLDLSAPSLRLKNSDTTVQLYIFICIVKLHNQFIHTSNQSELTYCIMWQCSQNQLEHYYMGQQKWWDIKTLQSLLELLKNKWCDCSKTERVNQTKSVKNTSRSYFTLKNIKSIIFWLKKMKPIFRITFFSLHYDIIFIIIKHFSWPINNSHYHNVKKIIIIKKNIHIKIIFDAFNLSLF